MTLYTVLIAYCDQKVGSPGGWVLQQVDHYEALNDSVFRITLKQAFPPF